MQRFNGAKKRKEKKNKLWLRHFNKQVAANTQTKRYQRIVTEIIPRTLVQKETSKG